MAFFRWSVFFVGLSVMSLHADQVIFKNGRCLDCDITGENVDSVQVSLGAGNMDFPKSEIERLVYAEKDSEDAHASQRKGKIYSAQNAPQAYAGLAADFRSLISKRKAALDARYMTTLHDRESAKLREKIKQLGDEIARLKRALATKSEEIAAVQLPDKTPLAPVEIRAYNLLVAQKQKLIDEGNVIYSRIAPLEEQYKNAGEKIIAIKTRYKTEVQPIVLYQKALNDFLNEYAEARQSIPEHPGESIDEFFVTLDRFLDRFNHEMSTYKVASEKVGDSTVVHAVVNKSTVGEFVFDTGASIMTISESFAKNLGVDVENLPATKMVLADGSIAKVKSLILGTVAVGEATAANVEACVVPDSPNIREDGLLGMSFLKYFIVGINGTTGEIELTKLQTESTD